MIMKMKFVSFVLNCMWFKYDLKFINVVSRGSNRFF